MGITGLRNVKLLSLATRQHDFTKFDPDQTSVSGALVSDEIRTILSVTKLEENAMGRPPIGRQAMSGAERQRRYFGRLLDSKLKSAALAQLKHELAQLKHELAHAKAQAAKKTRKGAEPSRTRADTGE